MRLKGPRDLSFAYSLYEDERAAQQTANGVGSLINCDKRLLIHNTLSAVGSARCQAAAQCRDSWAGERQGERGELGVGQAACCPLLAARETQGGPWGRGGRRQM